VKYGGLLRFVISFGISAVLLVLLVRGVDAAALGEALSAADWRLIPAAIGLYFVGAWLRSVRWGLLLPEYNIPTWTLFKALIVGFTVNNLLPIRMGEVARTYLLGRWRNVPYGATVASLVVERVLDGLSLAALLIFALAFIPQAPGYLLVVGMVLGAVFCAGAALLAVASWRADAIPRLTTVLVRPLPTRLGDVGIRLATSFARALSLVRGRKRLVSLAVLSLLAWSVELSLFFVLMPGFGIAPSLPLAFLVGAAANFATLVPSSPGYVGTFDGALIGVLRDTAGIASAPATAYAIVVHATLFVPVVLLGTLLLWRSHMTFDQITHRPAPSVPETAPPWVA
jgi:glycosyltransferase 2 family protein